MGKERMPGFTKLFSTILNSTIWGEPDHVRLVWITMLALSDPYGRVQSSVPGIAHQARVTLDQARGAIKTLESPDEDSRTAEFEGRRIAKMEGGWRLLNYAKYRAMKDEEAQAERRARKQKAYRERKKKQQGDESLPAPLPSVTNSYPIAEAEEEEEKDIPKIVRVISTDEMDGFDVARAVRETLSLYTQPLVEALDEVCCFELAHGENPTALMNKLIQAYKDYFGHVNFQQGPVRFFGEGTWKNRANWNFKDGHVPTRSSKYWTPEASA
jgi:hypothetical protein